MKRLGKLDIYTIPLLFLIPAAVILRSYALLTSFNSVTMHFDEKSAISAGNIIVIIAVIGFLSYLIFGEKEKKLIAKNDNAASYIPAGIVSTAMLFMCAQCFNLSLNGYYKDILSIVAPTCGVLALLSALSFFLSVFIERQDNLYRAAFSLFVVLFLAFYAILLYFNKQVHPTNSPNRIVDQTAFLSSALFFLFETRISLGRTKWRGYVSFGLIATLLCSYSAFPSLILYFANGYVISESLFENILTLALALFIFSKVLQIKRLTPDSECHIAHQISTMAEARADELRDHRTAPKALEATEETEDTEKDDSEDTSNYTFDIATPGESEKANSESAEE